MQVAGVEDDNIAIVFTETIETSAIYQSGILKIMNDFAYYYPTIQDFVMNKYSDRIYIKPGDGFALSLTDTFPYFANGLNIFPEFYLNGQRPNIQYFTFYPNPFKTIKNSEFYLEKFGKETIIFDNILPASDFIVMTFDGRIVFKTVIPEKSTDGILYRYYWHLNNNDGRQLASGVYIVIATDMNNQRRIEKIAIIR